jgi:hypothetical protein
MFEKSVWDILGLEGMEGGKDSDNDPKKANVR